MPHPEANAGIVSLAAYIPKAYHDADYIAAHSETPAEIIRTKLGWYQKSVPGPDDHTVAMGLKAARRALYYSGLEPSDIDLVIWSGEEVKEYRSWPVGPKIQKELGLKKAWSFDMQQRCGTTLVALKLARDMIRCDDSIQNVLIATGYRNSDLIDYENPRLRWMYYLAAGGAACIVQRDCPKNQILEGHFMSDGTFAYDVYVPAGGAAQPMTPELLEKRRQYLEVFDPEGMKDRLEKISLSNWLFCIDKALEKSGYSRKDVTYLDTLLVKRSAHDALVRELGLKPHQTRYLAEFGHHGQNDQILSLELAVEEGRIRDGDLILMISAGIGYAWDALVVEASSFQLRFIDSFHPQVAVLLNVAPDHLDWHGDFGAYLEAKARIHRNQGPGDLLVYDADDDGARRAVAGARSRVLAVSGHRRPAGGSGPEGGRLWLGAGIRLAGGRCDGRGAGRRGDHES